MICTPTQWCLSGLVPATSDGCQYSLNNIIVIGFFQWVPSTISLTLIELKASDIILVLMSGRPIAINASPAALWQHGKGVLPLKWVWYLPPHWVLMLKDRFSLRTVVEILFYCHSLCTILFLRQLFTIVNDISSWQYENSASRSHSWGCLRKAWEVPWRDMVLLKRSHDKYDRDFRETNWDTLKSKIHRFCHQQGSAGGYTQQLGEPALAHGYSVVCSLGARPCWVAWSFSPKPAAGSRCALSISERVSRAACGEICMCSSFWV